MVGHVNYGIWWLESVCRMDLLLQDVKRDFVWHICTSKNHKQKRHITTTDRHKETFAQRRRPYTRTSAYMCQHYELVSFKFAAAPSITPDMFSQIHTRRSFASTQSNSHVCRTGAHVCVSVAQVIRLHVGFVFHVDTTMRRSCMNIFKNVTKQHSSMSVGNPFRVGLVTCQQNHSRGSDIARHHL